MDLVVAYDSPADGYPRSTWSVLGSATCPTLHTVRLADTWSADVQPHCFAAVPSCALTIVVTRGAGLA